MLAADGVLAPGWRPSADTYRISASECLNPAYSDFDIALRNRAPVVPFIWAPTEYPIAQQYLETLLGDSYLPVCDLNNEFGPGNLPPVVPPIRVRSGIAGPLPFGLVPDQDVYVVDGGTKWETPRSWFLKFAAQPAGPPPECFTNEYAELPNSLKSMDPGHARRLMGQFMHGRQMRFDGMAAAYLSADPLPYGELQEYDAAKEMIAAFRELSTPDFDKFVFKEITAPKYGKLALILNPGDDNKCVGLLFGGISKKMNVRVHSRCLPGDLLHSKECDCGPQFRATLELFAEEGGLMIYTEQEGRDSGLVPKCCGMLDESDTYTAYQKLGLLPDSRTYLLAIEILDCVNDRLIKELKKATGRKLSKALRLIEERNGRVLELAGITESSFKGPWFRASGYRSIRKPTPLASYGYADASTELEDVYPLPYLAAKKNMGYKLDFALLPKALQRELLAEKAEEAIRARAVRRIGHPQIPGKRRLEVKLALAAHGENRRHVGVAGNVAVDTIVKVPKHGSASIEQVPDPRGKAAVMAARLNERGYELELTARISAGPEGEHLLRWMEGQGIRPESITEARLERPLRVLTEIDMDGKKVLQERRDFPIAGMTSHRDIRRARNSRIEAYLTATDLSPEALEEVFRNADGGLVVGRVVPASRQKFQRLAPLLSAFDVLTIKRDGALAMLSAKLGEPPASLANRLSGSTGLKLARLVRDVYDTGAVFLADAERGEVCSSSDQGEFSAKVPRQIRLWEPGATSGLTADVASALLESAGDVQFATQAAAGH